MDPLTTRLLDAALDHVVFDGWTETSFLAACVDAGVAVEAARAVCPRGALDLAVAYHRAGDAAMRAVVAGQDLAEMKIRERVTFAVRSRLEASDKEAVRRGAALFALPQHAALGAQVIWGTADAIWNSLGDPSQDGNWYSKRAILSGVYSSVVLYWLGDQSDDDVDTWAFLDRRIEDVLRIETTKGQLRQNPLTKGVMSGVDALFARLQAPSTRDDLPGRWRSAGGPDLKGH